MRIVKFQCIHESTGNEVEGVMLVSKKQKAAEKNMTIFCLLLYGRDLNTSKGWDEETNRGRVGLLGKKQNNCSLKDFWDVNEKNSKCSRKWSERKIMIDTVEWGLILRTWRFLSSLWSRNLAPCWSYALDLDICGEEKNDEIIIVNSWPESCLGK